MHIRKSRKIHVSGRKRILRTIQGMGSLHLWSAMVFLLYSDHLHNNSHHSLLGRTKLALYLWTSELQRRLSAEGSNIVVICANPGTVLTGMRDQPFSSVLRAHRASENFVNLTKKNWRWPISFLLEMLFRLLFVSTIVGAGNPLICAVGPQVRTGADAERYKGSYTDPIGKIATPASPPANSVELATELWDTTHTLFTEWAL